jgi:hypothetical protein
MERDGGGLSHLLAQCLRRGRTCRHLGSRRPKACKIDAIGVDEIQYSKGHKYLTLVYHIDLGITRLLWIGKERTIESFQGFFTAMGKHVISKIAFVCSEMWGTLSETHPRKLLRGPAYPRPLSRRRQYEQGTGQRPCRENQPDETRGPRPGPQEIPLATAPPQRESRRRPALPVARSPPLQPQDRPSLPSQGSLSATLGI